MAQVLESTRRPDQVSMDTTSAPPSTPSRETQGTIGGALGIKTPDTSSGRPAENFNLLEQYTTPETSTTGMQSTGALGQEPGQEPVPGLQKQKGETQAPGAEKGALSKGENRLERGLLPTTQGQRPDKDQSQYGWGTTTTAEGAKEGGRRETGRKWGDPDAASESDPMQGRVYTGAGEKGTGFENFERYVAANKEAAAQALKKRTEQWGETAGKIGEDIKQSEEALNKAIEAGKPTEYTGQKVFGSEEEAQKYLEAISLANQAGLGGGGTPLPERQPGESEVDYATRVYNEMNKTGAPKPETPQPGWYVSPDEAAKNAEGYTGPTQWGDFSKLNAQSKYAADRANDLSTYEGLAASAAEAGSTAGGSLLSAALMGGSSAQRNVRGVQEQFKALQDALSGAKTRADENIATSKKTAEENSAKWGDALKQYNEDMAKAAQDRLEASIAKTPKQSWGDYIGGPSGNTAIGWLARNLVNPQRGLQTGLAKLSDITGLPLSEIEQAVNFDPSKSKGRQSEEQLAGLFTGGEGGPAPANFYPDEEDVYNAFTQEELSRLGEMDPVEQRKTINAKKKQVRGG